MQPLVNEQKQKFLSTLIVSLGAFLGFEALSYLLGIYQLKSLILVSIYIYAFHLFWLTFLFDLHLRKRGVLAQARVNHKGFKMLWEALKERTEHVFNWQYFRHYQNYLILPGLIYWSAVILLFLNPFREPLKQVIVVTSSIAMTVTYWYMKEHFSHKLESHQFGIKILALVKLYTAFLLYSAVLGIMWYLGFDARFLLVAVFLLTFLLVYQALFQHDLLSFQIYFLLLGMAAVVSIISLWVYDYWKINYFTGGLVMLTAYNMLWGLLHHYLDHSLSKKVVFEYVLMTVLILSMLISGHDFGPRI